MKKVWELFPELTEAVRRDHEGKDCGHHPFEHALMVAQYCLLIAEDEQTGKLAAISGLLHNTDRLFPSASKEKLVDHLMNYLDLQTDCWVQEAYQRVVVDAVLNHSKRNDPADSPVLVCLKDADRLANINPFDIIARSARAFPYLLLVDPRFIYDADPMSTYRDPKTVFRDAIQSTLEWKSWLRLPKAIELAAKYFEGLAMVRNLTLMQLIETGLDHTKYLSR